MALILIAAILANVIANLKFPALLDAIPVIGLAVWAVILLTAPLRRPDWEVMPETFKGTIFLLALVTSASMMPVEKLPAASWQTALGLGFVSAVFDNIPLTALALKQGGYDWGFLAYAVGFGGSMIWFGSSAGVALSNMYPEAKSVGLWLRHGWHVAVAYVVGFFVMLDGSRLARGRRPQKARASLCHRCSDAPFRPSGMSAERGAFRRNIDNLLWPESHWASEFYRGLVRSGKFRAYAVGGTGR